jgi:ferredoxin
MKNLATYDEKCIGCDTCVTACSQLFFKEDDPEKSCIGIFPQGNDDFKISVCNQCEECVEACPTGALSTNKFGIVMLNKKLCNECHDCVETCPTNNIRVYRDAGIPFKCTVCGVCARECPAEALEVVTTTEH